MRLTDEEIDRIAERMLQKFLDTPMPPAYTSTELTLGQFLFGEITVEDFVISVPEE